MAKAPVKVPMQTGLKCPIPDCEGTLVDTSAALLPKLIKLLSGPVPIDQSQPDGEKTHVKQSNDRSDAMAIQACDTCNVAMLFVGVQVPAVDTIQLEEKTRVKKVNETRLARAQEVVLKKEAELIEAREATADLNAKIAEIEADLQAGN